MNLKSVAILAYHKIGDPPPDGWYTWNYVPENVFESHLCFLKADGWEVLNENSFFHGLNNPSTLPQKAALITFDDGYKSNLDIALPILRKFRYPAIIFVPTAYIGNYNSFDSDILYEPKEAICNWDELQFLERNKIGVQSHGVNHKHFSKLSQQEQTIELTQSKKFLEEKLNKSIRFFSFPYGDNGQDKIKIAEKLNEAGYKAACLYGGGAFDPSNASPFELERIAMGPDTNLSDELMK